MPRTHGYAQRGQRCYGKKDWNAKGRTNVIWALIGKALLTVALCTSNVNADVFHAWVTSQLLPQAPPGAVIVMDNATFHKRSDTQEAIKNAGFILEYLPPYSPDLNPIEHTWAHAKQIRRTTACSIDELFTIYM